MNARVQPLVAFLMAFVAVPLLAQQGDPPNGEPAAPVRTTQVTAAASPAPEPAVLRQVEGTILKLAANRLEMKVEKAVAPSSPSAAGLDGKTALFLVDATTARPAHLKVGDRVDIWFTKDGGLRRAVRIALAEAAGTSLRGATEPPAASVPPGTGVPPTGQPAALAPAGLRAAGSAVPADRGGDAMKAPASDGAAEPSMASSGPEGSVHVADAVGAPVAGGRTQGELRPESAAPLPFVALGGLAALAALVMLRFTLKGGHVEFEIGSGKGGLR